MVGAEGENLELEEGLESVATAAAAIATFEAFVSLNSPVFVV